MGVKLVVMGGLAVAFGATSYYAGNQYLESHTEAQRNAGESSQTSEPSVELVKVVVAAEDLPFGQKLESKHLKVVSFPKDASRPCQLLQSTRLVCDQIYLTMRP